MEAMADNNAPVTRQDLNELEARLGAQRKQDLEELKAYISGQIERSETNLLKAFHGWARAMEIRVRNSTTVVTGFEERLSLLEERVGELERRKAS
jgi:hypothetical protein